MENSIKKRGKTGKIQEPLLIGLKNDSGGVQNYVLRAYDRFIMLNDNFCIALEVLVKFYKIFQIKGGKEVNLFVNFWLHCMGLDEKNDVIKSLIAKLV